MVAVVGNSEDMLRMSIWGWEGTSLRFNHMYFLGSYDTLGPPWRGYYQEAQVTMAQFIHFLAIECWANQLMGKDVKRRALAKEERFGKLQTEKQEGKAKKLGPKRNIQNQGCIGTTGQSGHFSDTTGQGVEEGLVRTTWSKDVALR